MNTEKKLCDAAIWLGKEIENLSKDSGLGNDDSEFLKKKTEALADEIFSKNKTCIFVPADEKNKLKELSEKSEQHVISSASGTISEKNSTPLILDFETHPKLPALYFRRQFFEEIFISNYVKKSAVVPEEKISDAQKTLISSATNGLLALNDEQKNAVETILKNRFSVISGGPGTGKTTLLFRALLCFLKKNPNAKILLATPTGKSAARISESLNLQIKNLENDVPEGCENALKKISELHPATIHSALKIGQDGVPKFDENSQLNVDFVAIDEASMVSQNLMLKLLRAVPEASKIVLLGDKNQLDSVEPGHVFGDFYDVQILKNSCSELYESHRFPAESFIGKLSNFVLKEDFESAKKILDDFGNDEISVKKFSEERFGNDVKNLAEKIFPEILRERPESASAADFLAAIEKSRILSPMKIGRFGSDKINEILKKKFAPTERGEIFHGLPILITKNDNFLGLNNGDVGVVVAEKGTSREFKAYFGNDKFFSISKLPEFEAAYATTIHKSQGSEYSHLAVILPLENENSEAQLFSRQLLYTALTRYKATGSDKYFSFLYAENSLRRCIQSKTTNSSLLRFRLG